jgi:hypothetical protein
MWSAVCLSVSLFAGAPPEDAWQTVTVLRDGALTVRLMCRRSATLADAEWLALEFENAGQAPLTIRNVHYRIERESLDPNTGRLLSSGGLASGGDADLFPEAFRVTPVADRVLEPGKTRRAAELPSGYSAALLGLPPRDGARVRADCHLNLTLADGRSLRTPAAGVAFEFLWRYPDEAGFRAMRARLKQLLATPEQVITQVYIAHALLKVPEVSAAVTKDELLAALARREKVPWARPYIVESLAQRFPKDEAVRDYYQKRLAARDHEVVWDLMSGVLWRAEFVGPLVELYEGGAGSNVLTVLHMHRDDWKADARVPGRLAAAVRRSEPILLKPVGQLKAGQLASWSHAVHSLAMTEDRSAVELLRPALDDRRSWEVIDATVQPGTRTRVCDVALEAILTVLDGPAAAQRTAPAIRRFHRGNQEEEFAARDRLIGDLKKRLDTMGAEKKPAP